MATGISAYSKTAASNATASSEINWAEGQTPGSVNNSARQMMADEAKARDDQGGALNLAGGTTAYTVTTNGSVALAAGSWFRAVCNAANTAASTLAVDSLGSKKIRKVAFTGSTPNDVALDAADMVIDQICTFCYDPSADTGTGAWILTNPMQLAARVVTISSGSLPSATTKDIADIPATYRELQLVLLGVSSDTATRKLQVQISTDNTNPITSGYSGLAYDATANTVLATVFASTAGTIGAAGTFNLALHITNYQGGMYPRCSFTATDVGGSIHTIGSGFYLGGTSAVQMLRILWNGSGSFDAGTWILYGIR